MPTITHFFSDKSKAYISLYTGNDIVKIDNNQYFNDYAENSNEELYRSKFNLQWGNLTTAVHWNYNFSPKLFANFAGVYSRNRSIYKYEEENKFLNFGDIAESTYIERYNHSVIDDVGYRIEFDYRPGIRQHIRMGSNYLFHAFHPQSRTLKEYSENEEQADTTQHSSSYSYKGHEFYNVC